MMRAMMVLCALCAMCHGWVGGGVDPDQPRRLNDPPFPKTKIIPFPEVFQMVFETGEKGGQGQNPGGNGGKRGISHVLCYMLLLLPKSSQPDF